MPNTFDARSTFQVDGKTYPLLPARRPEPRRARRLTPAILAEDPAGKPAAARGRCHGHRRRHQGPGLLESEGRARDGDRVPPQPGAAPGLHRRPGDRRPGRHARRDAAAGRRPPQDQPAPAGRAGDRPLGPGQRGRHAAGLRRQRRAGVRAEPRAICLPPLGAGRVRQLPGRPARYRHRPSGQPRVPGPRRLRGRAGRGPRGVPGHAGRHRLAHDDDQRPGRAGLGRRRHRGRGRHAGTAGLDAGPTGRRLQADRNSAARGRPRPTSC